MRKNLIYSALVLLMGFVIYSCTKTDKDVNAIENQKEAIIQKTLKEIKPLEPTKELLEIASVETEENKLPCEASLPDCEESEDKYYYFDGTSDYPDCKFWIKFKVVRCENVTHMMYETFANYPACDEFVYDTEQGPNPGEVIDAVVDELIDKAIIEELTRNGGLQLCNEDVVPTVKLYKSSCVVYCGKRDLTEPFGYFLYPRFCGYGCCTSDISVCIDIVENEIKLEESNIQSTGLCESTLPATCARGDKMLTSCRSVCDDTDKPTKE